jgi:hypothetical protein
MRKPTEILLRKSGVEYWNGILKTSENFHGEIHRILIK